MRRENLFCSIILAHTPTLPGIRLAGLVETISKAYLQTPETLTYIPFKYQDSP